MGLAEELSYSIPPPTALQRSVQVLASSRPGAWTLSHTLPSMDRAVSRLSGGRTTVAELLAGLPVLVLTTIGRRTGQPRPAQLVALPFGETLALIGTNFGQTKTPTWAFNLEAVPKATLSHRDVSVEVVARSATEAERSDILALSHGVYGGYLKYLDRISGRDVRIFVLERSPST